MESLALVALPCHTTRGKESTDGEGDKRKAPTRNPQFPLVATGKPTILSASSLAGCTNDEFSP
ncbi:hypothetical protein [Reticulibacter mediterranei]|uniref:hypothetical protein n=1 Tax=Reticulibacter mediterranei TaxID=2778369 RepID=UPI001C68BBE0|nr:hypothetical protein [Reticulibacter mediterranei]